MKSKSATEYTEHTEIKTMVKDPGRARSAMAGKISMSVLSVYSVVLLIQGNEPCG
ncbi:hypothetical protein [Thiohalobacter sp. COW1]|uniref:hypothetical protein n=1 Tax=Thiohalobacter sp. COW1 TaxID=2795687 RepID=UPI00191691C0|nr:hypothetical protein [Thiohalobacter sp. COW1]